jgi:hemerythrin-like domain-containing protein
MKPNPPAKVSPLTLHQSPTAGFGQPFEMLEACHERVQRMLRLLARLREHLAEKGHNAQVQHAARDVMRYFDLAAPAHHEDEERHVFPPLLTAGECVAIVKRLQQDHLTMADSWAEARQVLQRLAGEAWAGWLDGDEARLDRFAGLYEGHIDAEQRVVFPAARARLDATKLAAMGQEMSRRRGLGR